MRHLLANIATYGLALGLMLAAALWAWGRSAQLVVARAPALEADSLARVASADAFAWAALGAHVYRANCQNCHGAQGTGRDVYPPVRGMEAHLAAPGGRDYLVDLTLYGLRSGLHPAPMPPMPELSDAQIAAVTNHVLTQFGRASPDAWFTPREVAARRGQRLREAEVGARRPSIPPPEGLGGP